MRRLNQLIAAGLTAGLFLAYLIALPPHLVHHLFDGEQDHETCSYLAQSQHTPGLQLGLLTLNPPVCLKILIWVPLPLLLPSADLTVGHPRAPPLVPPSA
jgi:hypothetical protein